jgi:sugar/nucleoside kinase (ribokinase family)
MNKNKILYVGSSPEDWNTDLDKTDLGRLGEVKLREGEKVFSPNQDLLFELRSGSSKIYLNLFGGRESRFDKNTEDAGVWNIIDSSDDNCEPIRTFDCLRRPGGGATNNIHVGGTLLRSINPSALKLELLVLEESPFARDILGADLSGIDYQYSHLRAFKEPKRNVHFRTNGEKIAYTCSEESIRKEEINAADSRLKESFKFEAGDSLVVNSIKDPEYLNYILKKYSESSTKPKLIAAVTNSMIGKRETLNLDTLVDSADVYFSNVEEFYELLKKEVFNNCGSHRELSNRDLYNGMVYLLNRGNKVKSKIYLTCGENGVVVMEPNGEINSEGKRNGNLYFQRISGLCTGPLDERPTLDLNGAGDSFAGTAILMETLGRYSTFEILDCANASSQISVRGKGANGYNRITKKKIKSFRKHHAQEIWKYNPDQTKFERHSSIQCNL